MRLSKINGGAGSPTVAAWVVCAVLFLVACTIAGIAPLYYVTLLIVVGLSALTVSGLTLLLISGQVSLGQAAFVGIGAYAAAIAAKTYGVPPLLAIPIGVVVTGLFGLVIGKVTLGLRGHFLPLATVAIGIAIPAFITASSGLTGGASGLSSIPELRVGSWVVGDRPYAVAVWFILIVLVAGFSRLMYSRTGRAIAALRSHSDMAEVFGVNVTRLKLTVFVAASMLAGLSGGLYTFYFNFLSPSPFALQASVTVLIAAIIGGAIHPLGAVVGAVTIVALQTTLQNVVARGLGLSGHVEMIVFGMVLVAVLLKWPGGIWSALQGIWPTFKSEKPSDSKPFWSRSGDAEGTLLKVDAVGKNFAGLRALDDISFSVDQREIVGLIGPNGAGKSTTFNIATGLMAPTDGAVELMGQKPPRQVWQLPARKVSRTFQHVKLIPEMTVIENVAFGGYSIGRSGFLSGMFAMDRAEEAEVFARAWRALDVAGLEQMAFQKASGLAMGQARLVEVARALVADPQLLFLDEPAAGLRTGEKLKLSRLLKRLKQSGMSVLLVEHDMDLVMNSVDRLVVIDRGRWLASGNPDEVRSNPDVIKAYLGA